MRKYLLILVILSATGCNDGGKTQTEDKPLTEKNLSQAIPVEMSHAQTFQVHQRHHYKIVDLSAPLVSWGGAAEGEDHKARLVLVPKDATVPQLTGDLQGATVIRTPVERIAVNYAFLEAILGVLGIKDKLVAVGGVKSYDDDIRAKARNGALAQIGYGWHMPPMIDPLVHAEPDVLFMVMGSMEHAPHMHRIGDLGIPVVPVFFEAETSYMGPVDYVRLVGMMTGTEARADAFVAMVEARVAYLKGLVAEQPKKKVLSSWYGGSERWMVTVRNADNALLEDAGGINPLAEPDDIRIDDFVRVGSETLLANATDIDCWIIRDSHSQPFDDVKFLKNFKAWQQGCLFASDGSSKPEADAFDIYATGIIRPDLILQDMIQMLHPGLIDEPFVFVQPDQLTPRS